jgi:N-acetylglucosamine malate deacetylase 1
MVMNFKRALVLAPHTDDGEIGAGGLISKLVEMGTEVYYSAFSICEESVPEELPKDILAKEVMEATAQLGILSENVFIQRFQVRLFTVHRQRILDSMINLRKEISPDLVIMPSKYDCHQDHITIHEEGVRAFRAETMLGYEIPWNNTQFEANLIVELQKRHIDAKMRAFEMYKSQAFRPYGSDDLKILSQARGLQIKTNYAEAYNVIRWLWR